ncbi:DUF4352 domain-containing protein [Bacillaceae bacterium C204]|uniref:DUF4352 domain-containing protein n=1 Tax=Neobacillus sp. 204 TaxID=3383351 RepID=UPI00397A3431
MKKFTDMRDKSLMNKSFKFGWLGFIALLVLIIIAAVARSGGNSSETPKEVLSRNSTSSLTKTKAPKEFQVGETFQLDEYKVSVNKVEKSTGNKFDKPKSGNEFVIVTVTIENGGTATIDYNQFDFNIKNSQGNMIEATITTIDDDTRFNAGLLPSGGKVSGTVVFEAPKDDTKLQLIFTPSFWSDKTITINL